MLSILATTVIMGQAAQPAITVKPIRTMANLRAIAYAPAPTGAIFAASLEDGQVRLINAASGQTTLALPVLPDPAYGIAFNPAGTRIATGDDRGRVWIFDTKGGAKMKEMPRTDAHTRGVQFLSFSADGRQLASTGKDDVLIVWDPAAARIVRRVLGKGANLYSGHFVPGAATIAAGTLSQGINFYKAADGAFVTTAVGHGGQGVLDIDFDVRGTRMIAAGRDGTASVWDAKTRRRLGSLKGHGDWVMQSAISPNGRIAATSSNDRTVIVWDLRTFQPIVKIEDQSAVGAPLAFTADGRFLITANAADAIQIHTVNPPQGVAAATPQRTAPTRRRRR